MIWMKAWLDERRRSHPIFDPITVHVMVLCSRITSCSGLKEGNQQNTTSLLFQFVFPTACGHVIMSQCRTVREPQMNPFHIHIIHYHVKGIVWHSSLKLFNQIDVKWRHCCDRGNEHEGPAVTGSTKGGDKLCCTCSSVRRSSLSDWLATRQPFLDSGNQILTSCLGSLTVLCYLQTRVSPLPSVRVPVGVCVVCQLLHTVNGNHWDGGWSVNSLLTLFCAHLAALHTSMIPSG